jgi:hypothetical protein
MLAAWLPRFLVPIAIALAFALFRRMAPPRARMAGRRYDASQVPEPLPAGVIGGAMWSLGIALAMFFFVLRWRESLMGVIGRPLAPDAVCSTGLLVLLAWICCCVDTMAAHSLVFAERGPLGRG